jgi:hypothetical protein
MASVYIQLPLSSSTIAGTIATNQIALTPNYDQSLVITDGAVVTLTKPAGAKKAKVWAGANTVNLRVTMDGTTAPSATTGMPFEPERSEDFEGVGNLKVIAETTATGQAIFVHWSV